LARDGGIAGRSQRKQPDVLRVVVSQEDRVAIEARARAVSLSVSAYLRRLGTGFAPNSTLDQQTVGALVKVNADQGRLGGLLKLWLSQKPGQGASTYDVRELLREIEGVQADLKAIVRRLK
jgi:hypothetical protein